MASVRRNSLCMPCQGFFQLRPEQPRIVIAKDYKLTFHDFKSPPTLKHHLSFQEFETSAKTVCHLCLLVYNTIPQDIVIALRDPSPEAGVIALQYARNQQVSVIDLQVWYPFSARVRLSQHHPGHMAVLHLYPEEANEGIRTTCPAQVTSLNTGSESSLKTALDWVRDCVDNHDQCRSEKQAAKTLPSRLISIGYASDFSDIRLCPTADLNGDITFVALSHCWGRLPILTLTTLRQEAFKSQIPFKSLPQTFKDALQVARHLRTDFNVDFIWIDSLCIIQDSPADWQQESAKMGGIYKNAFCLLAATSGTDGSSGLFHDRNLLSLCPVVLSNEWHGVPKGSYICKDNRQFDTDVYTSPLLRRAWVVQERTLATRILHFTAHQIYWECLTRHASEAYPQGLNQIPHQMAKDWSPQNFKHTRPRGKYYDPSKSEEDIYTIWSNVLIHYTSAKLTKPTDKLVAISGIAREMQSHLVGRDTYVAGLWKKNILHQLLWSVASNTQNSQQAEYRAPTWSWASVDSQLQQTRKRDLFDTSLVVISSIETVPTGSDEFSSLKAGFLRITGLMAKTLLVPGNSKGGGIGVKLYRTKDYLGGGTTDIDLRLGDLNHDVAWSMPLVSNDGGYDKSGTQKSIAGLLLKPIFGIKGQYERCGVFDIVGEDNIEIFMNASKSEKLANGEFEAFEVESGRYSITIV